MKDRHPLDEIKFGIMSMEKYRGCVVIKQPDGLYQIWQYKDQTAEQVDEKINESLFSLMKSIKE